MFLELAKKILVHPKSKIILVLSICFFFLNIWIFSIAPCKKKIQLLFFLSSLLLFLISLNSYQYSVYRSNGSFSLTPLLFAIAFCGNICWRHDWKKKTNWEAKEKSLMLLSQYLIRYKKFDNTPTIILHFGCTNIILFCPASLDS